MMEKDPGALRADIDNNTQQGTESLKEGHLQSALTNFQVAFRLAQKLNDGFTIRACAFNLGAVFVALQQPEKGLELLQRAIPPQNQRDGNSNGDLYYNFAIAYEALENLAEAVKYYELALDEYQQEKNNTNMEAEVATKAGDLHTELEHWLPAARAHGIVANMQARIGARLEEAVALSNQAMCLMKGGLQDKAIRAADNCMVLCQSVTEDETLGNLYNDLGLTYTQGLEFAKAATSFELALPLSRGPHRDKKQESVILQNLGAVYNSLGDFQRALSFHEEAAKLHAELGSRSSQGQCFTNLAFAHSQLGNHEAAGESYLHALQAAKDTGDFHAQWQAMEGLAAVAFNQGHVERAVKYFKMALSTLSTTEQNPVAKERIVGKLRDALNCQMEKGDGSSPDVQILVNSLPRPPSRQESNERRELIEVRKSKNARKREREFESVALGLSEYDTDSDLSLSNPSLLDAVYRSEQKDLQRQSSSQSSKTKRTTRGQRNARAAANRNQRLTASETEADVKARRRRLVNKRGQRSLPGNQSDDQRNLRRKKRGVLRTASYDSEGEWRKYLGEVRSSASDLSSDDDLEYRERLRPPSTLPEGRRPKKKKKEKNLLDINVHKLKKAMKDALNFSDSDDTMVSKKGRRMQRSIQHQDEVDYVASTGAAPRSRSKRKQRVQEVIEEESELASVTDSNSDTDTGLSDSEDDTDNLAATADHIRMPVSYPVAQSPLAMTYEAPLPSTSAPPPGMSGHATSAPPPGTSGQANLMSSDMIEQPGSNYFRPPTPPDVRYQGKEAIILPKSFEVQGPKSATSPRSEEDPLYQTITSIRSSVPQEGDRLAKRRKSSKGGFGLEEGPPLPPRENTQQLREDYLEEYQQKRESIMRKREDSSSDLNLPSTTKNGNKSSRTCAIQ